MRSAPYQQSSYLNRASPRSRATALFLSVGLTALIVLLLTKLGALSPQKILPAIRPIFQMLPDKPPEPAHAKAITKIKRTGGGASPPSRKPAPTVAIPPPAPPSLLNLTKEEFAATDIGAMRAQPGAGADGATAGTDSGSVYGPGEGPGGARLFNAEWYRRPTDSQMAYYMPPGPPQPGWGMIACRTVEKYHVEDCRELGETPGSGFARTLRQAAWQFLVQPPRIDGKPVLGAWVRIRFDFIQQKAK